MHNKTYHCMHIRYIGEFWVSLEVEHLFLSRKFMLPIASRGTCWLNLNRPCAIALSEHETLQRSHKPMHYQSSSSSSRLLLIALCLARKASASPPARLPPPILFGVARPLSVPLPVPRLTALSRAGGAGAGFRPAGTGRLVGGTGGVALPLVAPSAALPLTATAGVGLGAATGGGGGGAARACSISST